MPGPQTEHPPLGTAEHSVVEASGGETYGGAG